MQVRSTQKIVCASCGQSLRAGMVRCRDCGTAVVSSNLSVEADRFAKQSSGQPRDPVYRQAAASAVSRFRTPSAVLAGDPFADVLAQAETLLPGQQGANSSGSRRDLFTEILSLAPDFAQQERNAVQIFSGRRRPVAQQPDSRAVAPGKTAVQAESLPAVKPSVKPVKPMFAQETPAVPVKQEEEQISAAHRELIRALDAFKYHFEEE